MQELVAEVVQQDLQQLEISGVVDQVVAVVVVVERGSGRPLALQKTDQRVARRC